MQPLPFDQVVKELTERIEDLASYIEQNDSDSEYFQGVQEGYIIALAMLTGTMMEGTILPAY